MEKHWENPKKNQKTRFVKKWIADFPCCISSQICLFLFFFTQQHAFPLTWRAPLLIHLHDVAGVSDGCLTLAGSMLKEDVWHVNYSGHSAVPLRKGMPEGSVFGPVLFNGLPNSLILDLEAAGRGGAISGFMPLAWKNHVWMCGGTPEPMIFCCCNCNLAISCCQQVSWQLGLLWRRQQQEPLIWWTYQLTFFLK